MAQKIKTSKSDKRNQNPPKRTTSQGRPGRRTIPKGPKSAPRKAYKGQGK